MKKKKGRKIFWILVIILVLFSISILVSLLNQDSERIIENRFVENEIDKFDASKYPISIDRNQYPELLSAEKEISKKYSSILQIFGEKYRNYEYKCELNPTIRRLNFTYLKQKQSVYLINSYCRVSGDISPHSGVPDILFYVKKEKVVMSFNKKYVAEHFTDIFDNIKNSDQLEEYAKLNEIKLFPDLDSALNNSVLKRYGQEKFKKDCDFILQIPKLTSTVTKEGEIFVHQGLIIEPEMHARLYYLRYNITSNGQIVKDANKMLALCPTAGIIY